MQSSRSTAVVRTMVGLRAGEDVRCCGVGGAQDATNRAMSEQTAGMATEKHGRDDVSSEYPDGFLQAVKIPTAGGGQRWLKEEVGWLRAPTPPPPSRTIPRLGRRDKRLRNRSVGPWNRLARRSVWCAKTKELCTFRPVTTTHSLCQHGPTEQLRGCRRRVRESASRMDMSRR